MLFTTKEITGYKLHARDGELGKVKEFYFDDRHWAVRYLVADTGSWLLGRQVLLSPHALSAVNKDDRNVSVNLTMKQIEDSPSLDTDKPVSRQFEMDYYGYYGWPSYWSGTYTWGYSPFVWLNTPMPDPSEQRDQTNVGGLEWDPDLRSTHDVVGHTIQALDGEIGHVEDFIVDDETWAIRYLIVATRNWWPGKKVLLSPQWIERVSWSESKVYVSLSLGSIKQAPEYTDETGLTREYETSLFRHYQREGYWVEESAAKAHVR